MRIRREWLLALCLLCCTPLCRVVVAQAQLLDSLFPEGVPGYGTEQGVTVESRQRPEYEPLGIRIDNSTIRPMLGLSVGYDDNIFGGSSHRGGWQIAAQPSVLASTENSIGSTGLYLSANDVHYLGEPSQNRTDGSSISGRDVQCWQGQAYSGRRVRQSTRGPDGPRCAAVRPAGGVHGGKFPHVLGRGHQLGHRHATRSRSTITSSITRPSLARPVSERARSGHASIKTG